MKLKVLYVLQLEEKDGNKKHVMVLLKGANHPNGNKHLQTKDGIKHEILGMASTNPWADKNNIMDLEVEAPFDYKECELVP